MNRESEDLSEEMVDIFVAERYRLFVEKSGYPRINEYIVL